MRMHLFGTMATTALLASSIVPAVAFPLNNDPIAVNDSKTIQCGAIYTFYPLVNDYDPDGDGLTITAVETNYGLAELQGPDAINFDADAPGSAVILYTISDGHGGQAQATISVTINRHPSLC